MIKAQGLERGALAVLWAVIGYCWIALLPPANSPLEYLVNPAYVAMVGATLSAAIYSGVSVWMEYPLKCQRLLLALFLAGMPFIYLSAALLAHDRGSIILESGGELIFVPLAVLGYRHSLVTLGTGIAAHGVAWDAWHHDNAAYIAHWYPIGCLIVDLAFFSVAAASALRNQAKVSA